MLNFILRKNLQFLLLIAFCIRKCKLIGTCRLLLNAFSNYHQPLYCFLKKLPLHVLSFQYSQKLCYLYYRVLHRTLSVNRNIFCEWLSITVSYMGTQFLLLFFLNPTAAVSFFYPFPAFD